MIRAHHRAAFVQLKRDIPIVMVAAALIAIVGSITISARSWGVFGPIITGVSTQEKIVALTFDDGPTQPQTSRILSILRQEQIKATFYLIGVEMVRSPQATDDIIAGGHEIGNHSYTHNSLMFMTWDRLAAEIERTDALIRQHGYGGPITIRPPYGHKLFELPTYTALHHRQLIMWDRVLGNEPDITVPEILDDAKKIRPGSIVIMHVMYDHNKTTLDSVKPLITQLKSRGYTFVTVSELLNYH